MQKFNNITFDALDKECLSGSTRTFKKTTFDSKNYLDVHLKDNENEKELKIRLLPFDSESESPFKEIYVHKVVLDTSVAKELSENGSRYKSYICLEKTPGIDHEKYGTKCPFCEANRKALQKKKEAQSQVETERWNAICKETMPFKGYIVRCIDRKHEEDGPKFYKFNESIKKDDFKNKVLDLYKKRKAESIEDGAEPENILDLVNGKDLVMTINRGAQNQKSINVIDSGRNKPLSNDEEQMIAWINDEKKWSDVFAVKPYEYLELILNGEIPWYDREQKKWVKKPTEFNGNTVEEPKTEELVRQVVEKVQTTDEELPF